MTKKLISFFAVSIGYPLLILGKDPFSTKLIYNQKKNELAEQQLDFEKGKLNESKQPTSNKISGKKLALEWLELFQIMGNVRF